MNKENDKVQNTIKRDITGCPINLAKLKEQGKVGQKGATFRSLNETNQPTDQPTDTASYRGALSYLKSTLDQCIP